MDIKFYFGIALGIFFVLFKPFPGSTEAGIFLAVGSLFWIVIRSQLRKQKPPTDSQVAQAVMQITIAEDTFKMAEQTLARGDYEKARMQANYVLGMVKDINTPQARDIQNKVTKFIEGLS